MAGIQRFLRRHSTDALSATETFMYGHSVATRGLRPRGLFYENQRLVGGETFLETCEIQDNLMQTILFILTV